MIASAYEKDIGPIGDKISNADEQYSGSAKEPEKLSEPSDDAIKELEKLIRDIS